VKDPVRTLVLAALAGPLALAHVTPAGGQEPDTTAPVIDSVVVTPEVAPTVVPANPDTLPEPPMSPRGAFIRSMIVPGWGQSAFGADFRGGIYFAGWAGNWFMNFRNFVRLDDARERFDLRSDQVRDSLIVTSTNPDSVRAELEGDPTVLDAAIRADGVGNRMRKLVRAREQQREDWIAWSIFWLLASGVDAYVTAHLSDFPATIDIEPQRDRSVSLRLEVPLPGRRP
jgi:hypothetical protein